MSMQRMAVFFILLAALLVSSSASGQSLLVGSYGSERMNSIRPLTLPRMMLYDKSGKLIDRASWPSVLDALKEKAGEAFCCVSDESAPPGSDEPPPDCKPLIYGADLQEHFNGLVDGAGRELDHESLPAHEYLIVEYYADWCSPCHAARRELEALLSSPAGIGYLGLTIDFSKMEAN